MLTFIIWHSLVIARGPRDQEVLFLSSRQTQWPIFKKINLPFMNVVTLFMALIMKRRYTFLFWILCVKRVVFLDA